MGTLSLSILCFTLFAKQLAYYELSLIATEGLYYFTVYHIFFLERNEGLAVLNSRYFCMELITRISCKTSFCVKTKTRAAEIYSPKWLFL